MKKVLKIFLVIVVLFEIFLYSDVVLANEPINENSEFVENNANYSRAYLEYLKLSDEEKKELDVIPRKYNIPLDSIYEDTIEEKEESGLCNLYGLNSQTSLFLAYSNELPEQFDLREKIEIPRKNQLGYGLCWAFASLRSLETNLALNGYGEYDFSEWHMAYFERNGFGYELKPESGGAFFNFKKYTSYNRGPVLESEVPYGTKYSEDKFEYLYNLESKAYVEKTIDFPTINKISGTYTDEELELFRNKVKKHIMENGSIYACIFSENIKMINGYSTLYNKASFIDHAISIIGWDDNFPKENFKDENGNMPNNNGAYIIINSWGSSNEIIYVSYEDFNIEEQMSGVVSSTTEIDDVTKVIKFEDENLYEAIKDEMGKNILSYNNETMEIKCINSDVITQLFLENKEINNINGIENFINLEKIYLYDNNITDLTPLWNIKTLQSIYASKNELRNLGNVTSMPNLIDLDISNNKITSIDNIRFLNGLERLYMQGNQLLNIDEIGSLEKLWNLNISENQIESIDFIESLKNLINIELCYNNIHDVSNLNERDYLNLSGNPITEGLDKLTNVSIIILDECSLDSCVLDILSKLNNLKSISLRKNNITDASKLKNLELNELDLSGNKNLELETVPVTTITYRLALDDCNISDVTIFKKFKGSDLSLNDNPITDVTQLKDIMINSISLRNTNLEDVSALNNVFSLDISGNKNITGLDKLSSVTSLLLNNCNISDITDLSNLKNLKVLKLENNNISSVDCLINLSNLNELYVSNNNIERIPDFHNLFYMDFSNNKITNIDNVVNWLNEFRVCGNLTNNFISEVPKFSNADFDLNLSNQTLNTDIEIMLNKDNRITLKNIITMAYKTRFQNVDLRKNAYDNQTRFETENCEIDFVNNQIIISPDILGKGIATIKINGGSYDGTIYKINYNTQENLEPVGIIVKRLPDKLIYLEGENFEPNGMAVDVIYENDIREEISDYIIVNGESLKSGEQSIFIRNNEKLELETKVDIMVYVEDEIINAQFPDKNLYNAIKYGSMYGPMSEAMKNMILNFNDDTNTLIMKKEIVYQIDSMYLEAKNIENISGIENFINLKYISLNNNENLEKIDELIGLSKLEVVNLSYTKVADIENLLNKSSIKNITIAQNANEIKDVHKQEIVLPKYIYQILTMQKEDDFSVDVNIYYEGKYDEFLIFTHSATTEIKIDNQKQVATVELDREITEEKKEGIRKISLWIEGGKTDRFLYDIIYNVKSEEILEISINEYQEEQDGEIKYIKNIAPGVTVDQVLEKIKVNSNATKIVYDGLTEVANNGILATGMKIVISLNNQVEEYIVVVSGDINGNGSITATDLTKIKNYILEKTLLTSLEFEAADLNNDGKITATELTKIKKYVLGLNV